MAKFYVTTPIYYANSNPHIGSVYTTIAADILVRWHKLLGEEVFFLTGTDEHGQKIQETAEKSGKKPQEFVDAIAKNFEDTFKLLNISNDFFIRTTNPKHKKIVQEILQKLYDKKLIYKGVYESCYCVGCEQYLNKSDLVDGKCPLHLKEVQIVREESYMLKLSAFQNKLLKAIESKKFLIVPEKRRNEMIQFIKSGLQDISISRLKKKVHWGIEMPFDKNHTCYVWVDAFWNYITGLQINKKFDDFWPADVQLMANDILRVHSTIWPALLMSMNLELPKKMFIHGYFTVNGQKMSKSLGNVIDPIYISHKYSTDALRYFLMREIPFGQDGDFSEKALVARLNSELADSLGNLLNRVIVMCDKYFKLIPSGKEDKKLTSKLNIKKIEEYMEKLEFNRALEEIWKYIDECNKYVNDKEPWKLAKNNEKELKNVLYNLAESIRIIGELIYPFMPETSEKIHKQLGYKMKNNFNLKFGNSKSHGLGKAEPLFKKIKE